MYAFGVDSEIVLDACHSNEHAASCTADNVAGVSRDNGALQAHAIGEKNADHTSEPINGADFTGGDCDGGDCVVIIIT